MGKCEKKGTYIHVEKWNKKKNCLGVLVLVCGGHPPLFGRGIAVVIASREKYGINEARGVVASREKNME